MGTSTAYQWQLGHRREHRVAEALTARLRRRRTSRALRREQDNEARAPGERAAAAHEIAERYRPDGARDKPSSNWHRLG